MKDREERKTVGTWYTVSDIQRQKCISTYFFMFSSIHSFQSHKKSYTQKLLCVT